MKFKKTAAAVALFVLMTFWAFNAEAEVEPVIGLATGVLGPHEGQTQILGVLINDRWGINYERFTDVNSVSAWRRVYFRQDKRLRPLFELGATYFDDLVPNSAKDDGRPIVDSNLTFHLGVGAQYQLGRYTHVELRWLHNSTAGRSNPNTGLDRVSLTYTWSL